MKSLISKYFKAFELKKLEDLSLLFSDTVSMKDWNVNVKGKKKVILELDKIFKSIGEIKIEVKEFYENKNKAICVICITGLNSSKLNVIDIITFNNNKKIIKIDAYKQ